MTLLDARDVVDYYESRAPRNQKSYPPTPTEEAEARRLFDFFFDTFGVAVRAWAYAQLLDVRPSTERAWATGAPWWERLGVYAFYPFLASEVRRTLGLKPDAVVRETAVIDSALSQVEARLADGRRYLMGNLLTAPDLALAALSAPIVIPPQYGGPLPSFDELPAEMKRQIEAWRARPAGQFILRLYAENRPRRVPDLVALGKHGSGRTFKDKLANFLIQPAILRPIFTFLRQWSPILVLGKTAIVSRYTNVVEVLKRDTDFTLAPINAPKIDQIDGPFILGMDASSQYDREKAALLEVVRREDLEFVRQFVSQSAVSLIDAARPRHRIDVVNGLARVVPIRLLSAYFGIP
ncbi:MAG TPA: hypothetical protein VLZ30_07360, partial [Verrucomicrobiae bacterium]|nr:hypothetical protein [Verrucomicrobiae bacterium]